MSDRKSNRAELVRAAVLDEVQRVNGAIAEGGYAYVKTFTGNHRLRFVARDFDYHTTGNGGFGQTWSGCNDPEWARIMAQLGLPRHPLFEWQ